MAGGDHEAGHEGILLGETTPVPTRYAPDILFPIPRSAGRAMLGADVVREFQGVDIWHAYELSWLQRGERPVSRVGRIAVPATSVNIVESKSLKLYLNSLNNHRFDSDDEAIRTISADVGRVVGCDISLELLRPDDASLAGQPVPGQCIDDASLTGWPASPSADLLQASDVIIEQSLYSHLLRSLCPVTGQPDWASIWIDYRGPAIDPSSLLAYLLSYRDHQDFHEQCVERIFTDILRAVAPERLTVQALYTRRGGLDICPLRSTEPGAQPLPRLNRQ